MAKAQYWQAKEVETIAQDLITKFHQHILDFKVKMKYLFTDKVSKKNGKEVWGACKKVTGMNAYLSNVENDGETYFAIIIPKDIWDVLPEKGQMALTDHCLCQVLVEADQKEESDGSEPVIKYSNRPYDIQEYNCIARRYGLWRDDYEEDVFNALKSGEEDK